jgi:hypothetical protein
VEFSYFLGGKWMSLCVMGAVSFPAGEQLIINQRREDSRGDGKEKIGNIQE